MDKFSHVIKRSGAIVPFNRDRIANAIYRAAIAVGGRDRARAEWLADRVVEQLESTYPADHTPHIEEIQDLVEKVLIENGHSQVAKEYILYREQRARKRKEKADQASSPSENIPWAKIWRILDWAVSHNLHTTEALNQRLRAGEFHQIVHESECAYEEDLDTTASLIQRRLDQIKMVIVSGPSSSGKTTTTIKLEQRLESLGQRFVVLNIDNYFFDLEMHPKDEFGDYDFETPQALDLDLISEHLQRLIQGELVRIPYYDFKTGTRTLDKTPFRLEENEILLIDSLHGLFPKLTMGVPEEMKFKLYIEPLLQMKGPDDRYIRWTDLRLIRRMLRDASHRAYDPQRTLEHWHYVRASEMRYIIPNITSTDFVINSAMPYELSIYRPKIQADAAEWELRFRDDPLKQDAHTRAARLNEILSAVDPVEDTTAIPSDSVLREFIGGSSLKY
jgi:uridine kinase